MNHDDTLIEECTHTSCRHDERHIISAGECFAVRGHNCEYVDRRNSLIPDAVAYANKLARFPLRCERCKEDVSRCVRCRQRMADYARQWNRYYFERMDSLAKFYRIWSRESYSSVRLRLVADDDFWRKVKGARL